MFGDSLVLAVLIECFGGVVKAAWRTIVLPKDMKAFSFAAKTAVVTSWHMVLFGVRNVGLIVELEARFVSEMNCALSSCS